MLVLKNPKIAVPVVLFAGLVWSFGPLVVRYMDNPHLIPWQYIFGRGLTIFILLNLYLFFEEEKDFYKNYFKIGISGLVGGSGLGVAMISFMISITNTSAAITSVNDNKVNSAAGIAFDPIEYKINPRQTNVP